MKTLLLIFILILLAAPLRADPAPKPTWQPVGLSGGGAMFNPVISTADPNTAMVECDMSAAYLTHDGGKSWNMIDTAQLRSNTRCTPAFHPTDPKIIYAPHNSSDLKVSRDGGHTWSLLHSFKGPLNGPIAINPHDPRQIIVGAGESTFRSTDAGQTFQPLSETPGHFIGAHFPDAVTFFVATDKGAWHWAKSYSKIVAGLPDISLRGFTGSTQPGNATTLYCTIPGKNENGRYTGGIYTWTNASSTWQPAGTAGLTLDIKPFDQWSKTPVTQFHDIAACDANPNLLWATDAGAGVPPPHHSTVYRSDDAGKSWRQTFFPDPRYKNCNVEKGYTVVEDGQFYQDIPHIALDPHNPDHILQINGGDCYFTTDAGKSWRCGHTQAAGDPKPGVAWKNTGLVVTTTWNYYIDPHEPNRHYICYTDIGFARSLDAGQTWIWWSKKDRSPWPNTCYELAFDPDLPGKIFGAFSDSHDIPNANVIYGNHRSDRPGGICVSTDFAATWKPLPADLPKLPCTSIILDPTSPKTARTLYAAIFGKGIYKSTDGGATWKEKNTGLGTAENMRVYRIERASDGSLFALITALRKDNKFVEPGPGLYRSTNAGDSWQCITQSIPALWPKDFTVDPADPKTLYLGLADASGKQAGGLYRSTDAGLAWNLLTRQGREHFGGYLNPHHPGWIYATLTEDAPSRGLFLSKDNGKTFAPLPLPFDNAMRVTTDPANPDLIYVTTFGGSIWRGPAD